MVDTAGDSRHLEPVEVAVAAKAVDVERLVAQRVSVPGRLQMADRRVQVDGLHREPVEHVHRVQHLAEPEEVAVTVAVTGSTHTIERDVVRGARHRGEHDAAVADHEIPMRRGAVQRERGRDRRQALHHHLGVEAHPVAVDPGASRRESGASIGVQDVDSGAVQHLEGGEMDRLDLIIGDDAGQRLGVARLHRRRLIADD